MEFVGKLKELIDEQEREIESGHKTWKVSTKGSIFIFGSHWLKMTKEQRQTHLKKLSQAAIKSVTAANTPSPSPATTDLALAIDVETVSVLLEFLCLY